MRGIPFYQYKLIQENLENFEQNYFSNLDCDQQKEIALYDEKLKKIYSDYRNHFQNISEIVTQFDEHKEQIRKLIRQHKKSKSLNNDKQII